MNFNNKNFVSADPLFAQVKEELSSYFNTGAVDDLLFPKYLSDVLKTLRKSALPVKQTAVVVKNGQGELPTDFDSVREIWMCGNVTIEFPNFSQFYRYEDYTIENISDPCTKCKSKETTCDACDPCRKEYMAVHRVTKTHLFSYNYSSPLKPSNLSRCGDICLNRDIESASASFDISGCNIMVHPIKDGILHLVYYSNGMGEEDEQMIPDDWWVQEYLMKYLKYKIFQRLYNMATDETFNQSRVKYQEAEQAMIESRIVAETELKKETRAKTKARMSRTNNRFNSYYRMLNL